ncbi:MAG: hypothetical protein N3E50_05685 [Candidatus Goldbacteria bacterium]|nr:hypothetical protein [Candidatus Goldiibacteriota bacterium]
MKKRFFALVLSFILLFCVFSYSSNLTFDVTLNGATKYLWRGQKLYNEFCLQPNLNIYVGNFTINYWATFPLDKGEYIESDFTLIASERMPYLDIVKLNAGFIIYTFPNNFAGFKNTLEIFGIISLDTILSPYLKLNYDSVLGNGYYLESGISYSIPISLINLNLYATAGYNFNQWGYTKSFSVLLLTPEITYSLGGFTAIVSTNVQVALDSQYENDYIVNFGIKYSFN